MAVQEEVVSSLRDAIAIVEGDLGWCKAARADDLARDAEVRFGSGVGTPPRPWAGYNRGDTGITITDCSELEQELQRLNDLLAKALAGDLPTDLEHVPESTSAEQEAVKKAEQEIEEQRQQTIAMYREYSRGFVGMGTVLGAGTVLVGAITLGLALSGAGLPGVPAGAGVTLILGAGAATCYALAWHLNDVAAQLEKRP
jgi:hypothetical protein